MVYICSSNEGEQEINDEAPNEISIQRFRWCMLFLLKRQRRQMNLQELEGSGELHKEGRKILHVMFVYTLF